MVQRTQSSSPRSVPASAGEVLQLIRAGEAATRTDIGRLTGLSRTAVTLRVNQLLEHGLVVERADGPSTGGRPPARLEFHTAGGTVLAASIGASRAKLAVCDLAGEILAESSLEQDISNGPKAVLSAVAKHLDHLLAESGQDERSLRGIGVSIPGPVEIETGRTLEPPVMPGWDDVPIPDYFTARLPVPVHVDNDVNVLALGAHHQHPAVDDLLFVKVSTGVGAGIVSGGRLQRGALGAAGEIGHTPVCDGSGRVCRCGNVDCLETVAAGWALERQLAQSGRTVDGVRGVVDLVRAGDPEALRLVREAGRRLGEVLAGAVNLLNPAMIVVGGDLAHVYDPLVAGLREMIYQRSTALATRNLRIIPSAPGERTGAVGCAVMVLEDVLSPRSVDAAIARGT